MAIGSADDLRTQVNSDLATAFAATTVTDTVDGSGGGTVNNPDPAALLSISGTGDSTTSPLFVSADYGYIQNTSFDGPIVLFGDGGSVNFEGDVGGETLYLAAGYNATVAMQGFNNVISGPSSNDVDPSTGFFNIVAGLQSAATGDTYTLATTVDGGNGTAEGNIIYADAGNYNIALGAGANQYWLGSGTSVVYSEGTGDVIVGGAGASTVQGANGVSATAYQGTGSLEYDNGSGTAVIAGSLDSSAVTGLTVQGGDGSVTVYGSLGGSDSLVGGLGGNNYLVANGVADTLFGGGSGDTLVGAFGGDTLVASNGNTTLFGGAGDALFTGNGNDVVVLTNGDDSVTFGAGQDQAFGSSGTDDYVFNNGAAGGVVSIADFNTAQDFISLGGYGSDAPSSILASETVSGGNTSLAFSDGTSVTLFGVTDLTEANFTTFGNNA